MERARIHLVSVQDAEELFWDEVEGILMKKAEAINIHFMTKHEFRSRMNSAIKTRKPLIQPRNEVYFERPEGFRSFMTIQKIEILTILRRKSPKSIYELAKIVGRNFAAVFNDCNSLAGHEFIELVKSSGGRGALRPKLTFPYKKIIVHLPANAFQIEFSRAA